MKMSKFLETVYAARAVSQALELGRQPSPHHLKALGLENVRLPNTK